MQTRCSGCHRIRVKSKLRSVTKLHQIQLSIGNDRAKRSTMSILKGLRRQTSQYPHLLIQHSASTQGEIQRLKVVPKERTCSHKKGSSQTSNQVQANPQCSISTTPQHRSLSRSTSYQLLRTGQLRIMEALSKDDTTLSLCRKTMINLIFLN